MSAPHQNTPTLAPMTAPPPRAVMLAEAAGPVAEAAEGSGRQLPRSDVIWEGSTWDAMPLACACCAPLCCQTKRWRITTAAVDVSHGCCFSKEDTTLVKRIRDVSFESNCCVRACCLGRGTIVMHSSDATHPEQRLTTWHAKGIYSALKRAITSAHTHMGYAT